MPRPTFTRVALLIWALAIAGGFRVLVEYELRAGPAAVPPQRWPTATSLPFDGTRTNLVMFAHPQCPCSRATMAELAVMMTRVGEQLRATVCFFAPDGEPESWTRSGLWQTAAALPGVQVVADRNNAIAKQFGSATSGQVFLFDADGRQIFSGGITGARGHQGENRGRNFVIALARGELCDATRTPVFGCSLQDAHPAPASRDP